jgi:hypothetical protein
VADAGRRRDARGRNSRGPTAAGAAAAVERIWTPAKGDDEGPKRVN